MGKQYNREVQALCKTLYFKTFKEDLAGTTNNTLLNDVIDIATKKAPLISSIISGVGLSRFSQSSNLHQTAMKLVAVLIIFCRSSHRNNSNYIPLLIALYMYSAGIKVDAIILLNRLGLSILYNILQKKLWDITSTSKQWIKQQATNRQLVGTWDNFEF